MASDAVITTADMAKLKRLVAPKCKHQRFERTRARKKFDSTEPRCYARGEKDRHSNAVSDLGTFWFEKTENAESYSQ